MVSTTPPSGLSDTSTHPVRNRPSLTVANAGFFGTSAAAYKAGPFWAGRFGQYRTALPARHDPRCRSTSEFLTLCNCWLYIPSPFERTISIRGGDMKSHVSMFALLLPLALAGAGSALAADAGATADTPATCSEATLRGTYLFATNGFNVGGKFKGPFAAGGYEVHDGHGHTRQI